VRLLRGFELRREAQPVLIPPGAQRLIAFLALERVPMNRLYVAGALWIDSNQEAANANLRTALWRLKRLPYRLVDATATHVSLASDVVVDVHGVGEIARRVSTNDLGWEEDEVDCIVMAGELLPDWYDDWLVIERERLRQARLHALETICDALSHSGRYGKAIEVGLAAVACEPLRESAHRAVIRAHLGEGNSHEALRQYDLCRHRLEILGMEPSHELEKLRRRCAGGPTSP
jgi:DNA-binding SARP family transcriptional activator